MVCLLLPVLQKCQYYNLYMVKCGLSPRGTPIFQRILLEPSSHPNTDFDMLWPLAAKRWNSGNFGLLAAPQLRRWQSICLSVSLGYTLGSTSNFWLLLATFGYFWLLLALLDTFGYFRQLQAVVGRFGEFFRSCSKLLIILHFCTLDNNFKSFKKGSIHNIHDLF